MIGPGADAKVLICTQPIDGRKGIDSLVALVQNGLGQDPFHGVVYIFRSKRKDRLKILWWDGSGALADDQACGIARWILLAAEA